MKDETIKSHPPEATGIQPGIALVKHSQTDISLCSIRTFTFDQYGQPTVTVLDLDHDQARRLRDALTDALVPEEAS